ncbi:MAG: hypothetical protein ACJ0SL_01435 [Candidatus Rariloculaceae bacterium]
MPKIQRRWKIAVETKRQGDPLVLKALPTTAKLAVESNSLTEKVVSRVEWMQENGIDRRVEEPKRRRSTSSSPRPGTLIYFESGS